MINFSLHAINTPIFTVTTDGTNGAKRKVIAKDLAMFYAIEAAKDAMKDKEIEDVIITHKLHGMVAFVGHDGNVKAPLVCSDVFRQQILNLQGI